MKTAWMTTDAYSIGIGEDASLAVRCDFTTEERHNLVAMIVRAVNNHDKLVEALRNMVQMHQLGYDGNPLDKKIRYDTACDLLALLES